MASQGQSFGYQANDITALELALSPERLQPYLTMAQGHRKTAILLYERNTSLSEALYGVTQAAEVALRNCIHRTLSTAHQSMWFNSVGLTDPQADMVLQAEHEIRTKNRTLNPGSIVAELNLGFWTSLVSAKYEKNLWVPHLHKVFSNAIYVKTDKGGNQTKVKLDRRDIHLRLESLRSLRNRIAHHESILKLDLERLYLETLEALTWVCPTSAQWVRSTNCFAVRFNQLVPTRPAIIIPTAAAAPRPGMPIRTRRKP